MKRVVLVLAALALGLAVTEAWLVVRRVQTPYKGYAGSEQFVDIPPGTSVAAIGYRLVEAGVIRDRLAYRYALWRTGAGRDLKAGEYRFDRPMTPIEVVRKIQRGEVYLRPVTFPEGLTIVEMATIYERAGLGSAAEFAAAARRRELVAAIDPAAKDLEGYLFPDTYALPRRAGADELVRLMVARFERAFDASLRAEAARRGLTVRQAVTLASLVEKETGRPEERPLVAAVYHNRLRAGMPLQCDPTVIYALQRDGRWTGNLRREDLRVASPYNTYRYLGLPPGPIAAPGRASLEAAVRPADVSYLYFVSRNDGSHVFATTLAEHNRNVRHYQVLFFRQSHAGR
ncbi:MAG TPA: endolytic transglycosylase MltG [Vicinamibacterales bacterium]|nr:endolytic transglycosylase MltG [Vicinamibacterales bacterium]